MKVGAWVVEPTLLQIRRDETIRRLEPIGMNPLLLLADRAPDVITRDEIFEIVWEGRAVVDETLSRAVSVLRHALDDDARSPRYIETIPTKGYRLIAVVDRAGGVGWRRTVDAYRPSAARRKFETSVGSSGSRPGCVVGRLVAAAVAAVEIHSGTLGVAPGDRGSAVQQPVG